MLKRIFLSILLCMPSVSFAAIAKEMNWYVRAGGAETNGGGYDGTNYPGGVNYADQDSPQLSITDLTSTASTTVTSVLSTFTANMVGNVLRIASGTGATTGYYVITAYVSGSQVTLDRVSGTYTAGVASVGGAHAWVNSYANGGGGVQPILTTPLVAGNTIWVRGAGSNDPSNASPDYTTPNGSYWQFPAGDLTSGPITLKGYNGRPLIKCPNLVFYAVQFWRADNFKIIPNVSPTWPGLGWLSAGSLIGSQTNIIYDQNGEDAAFFSGGGAKIKYCEVRNTGGGTAGSVAGMIINTYGANISSCWIHGIRGDGIAISSPDYLSTVENNIIANNLGNGITVSDSGINFGVFTIKNNTIDANGGDGVNMTGASTVYSIRLYNNSITNHSTAGKYGLNITNGTTASNDFFSAGGQDYNNYYGNNANYHNISAGTNDIALDPQYTSTGSNNYAVGTNLKAKGYPLSVLGSFINPSATRSYEDIGAAQRQESSSGGSQGLWIQ